MAQKKTKLAVTQPLIEQDTTAQQHFRTWLNWVQSQFLDRFSIDVDADVTGDVGVTGDLAVDGEVTVTGDLVLNGGTLKFQGTSTVWDDLRTSLIGRRLASTAGTVNYDYAENAVVFSPNGTITDTNDTVVFNFQLPHAAIADGSLKVHMHYEQDTATTRTFALRYRIQDNGEAKTTAWTTVSASTGSSVFPYTGGTINNILPLATVDLTGIGISAVVQVQMTRTDSNTGDVNVTFIDGHFEMDQLGSDTEYTK